MDAKEFSRTAWARAQERADIGWIWESVVSVGAGVVATLSLGQSVPLLTWAGAFETLALSLAILGVVQLLGIVIRRYATLPPAILAEEIARRGQVERDRDRLRDELDRERARTRPAFSVAMENCLVAPHPQHGGAIAHLELELVNSGVPSVAIDWLCTVTYGGREYQGTLYVPREDVGPLLLTDTQNANRITLTPSDFIPNKTAVNAIQTGQRVVGWIGVIFTEVSREQMFTPGTVTTVSFADSIRTRWSASKDLSTGAPSLRYKPGGVRPG